MNLRENYKFNINSAFSQAKESLRQIDYYLESGQYEKALQGAEFESLITGYLKLAGQLQKIAKLEEFQECYAPNFKKIQEEQQKSDYIMNEIDRLKKKVEEINMREDKEQLDKLLQKPIRREIEAQISEMICYQKSVEAFEFNREVSEQRLRNSQYLQNIESKKLFLKDISSMCKNHPIFPSKKEKKIRKNEYN